MYSFKQYLHKDDFVIALAKQYFNLSLDEAADTAIEYYRKDPQVIMISQHGLDDGKSRDRLWWDDENHLKDPKFTNFADKCLERMAGPLDDYDEIIDSLNKDGKVISHHLDRQVGNEMGFCDFKKEKGWVVRLNKSSNGEITSFTIITVLYLPVMNKNAPLFVKPDTYVVNIDKPIPKSKNKNNTPNDENIDAEIKKLTDEYEMAYIEADDMPEGRDKKIALKNVDKLQIQIQNLKNRRNKLKSTLSVESVEVVDNETDKKLRFIMV